MRNELQHIEQIEKYLHGEMNAAEAKVFEENMKNNPALAEQVATQQLVMQAAVRKALKADIAKYGAAASGGFSWIKWLGITTGVVVIAMISYFAINSESTITEDEQIVAQTTQTEESSPIIEMTPSLDTLADQNSFDSTEAVADEVSETAIAASNEHTNKDQKKSFSYAEDTECGGLKTWVEPDRQIATINPQKGAIVEGKEGTLIIVPTDAFVDDNGKLIKDEVELELVEALKVSDMLAYNLTTMNNENALQSGGMIYIQPTVDGKKVNINPDRPLYIEIPTDDYNPDMKAWEGVIDENGDINWENPKELEKFLTIVDFDLLDLLPNGFEEAVAAGMPFKNHKKEDKALVDSLYYSLEFNSNSKNGIIDSNPCDEYDNENLGYFTIRENQGTIDFGITVLRQSGEVVPNANCELKLGSEVVQTISTDKSGFARFTNIYQGVYQIKICDAEFVTYASGLNLPYSSDGLRIYTQDQAPEKVFSSIYQERTSNSQKTFEYLTGKKFEDREINNTGSYIKSYQITKIIKTPSECNKCDEENSYDNAKFKDGSPNASIIIKLTDESFQALPGVACDLRIGNSSVFSAVSDSKGYVKFPQVINGLYQFKACNGKQAAYIYDFKITKGTNPLTPIMPFVDPTQLTEMQWGKRVLCGLNSDNEESESNAPSCFISPQSIKTIKSDQFSNTFLSTKEFEERIKVLHQMPNAQSLFDLYVNNLGKNLWEVDEMVAAKLDGADKQFFTDFATQKLTNVKDANIYQGQLSAFYNKKKQEYIAATKKANAVYQKKSTAELTKYQSEISKLKSEYNSLTMAQNELSSTSTNSGNIVLNAPSSNKKKINFPSINLPLPNKKLPKQNVATTKNSYATTWYSSGWMNIDAYLHELDKGNKTVEIEVKEKSGKVYQCLNMLKTIVPLTITGIIAKAKFPKPGTPAGTKMRNTYTIGIRKDNGQLQYAETFYNPYKTNKVSLNWTNVSSDELKDKLMRLDGTELLLDDIQQQEEIIQKQLEIKKKKAELELQKQNIQNEMNAIIEKTKDIEAKLAKERAFISSLEAVVNKCGVAFPISASVVEEEDFGMEVFEIVDEMPEYPGGQAAMYQFIGENVVYPTECLENDIQGKVYVKFIVGTSGKLRNVIVLKSANPLLDAEAVRVVNMMPPWTPGKKEGTKVPVAFTIPLNFTLD